MFEDELSNFNLIQFREHEGFSITKEAEDYLNSISNEISLGIISIAGKKSTGKTYFINNALFSEKFPTFKVEKSKKIPKFKVI